MLPPALAFAIFALYLSHRIYTNVVTIKISCEDYQERFKKITKKDFPTKAILAHTLVVLALYSAFLRAQLPYFWLLLSVYYLILTCVLIFMAVHPLLSDRMIEDAVAKSATIDEAGLNTLKGRSKGRIFLSIGCLYLWCYSWGVV